MAALRGQARAGHRRGRWHRPGDRARAGAPGRGRLHPHLGHRARRDAWLSSARRARTPWPCAETSRGLADCARVVDEAAAALGGLDGLVNNAGITRELSFEDTTPELFASLFDLNVRGYFFCAQRALRHFAPASGCADRERRVDPRAWRPAAARGLRRHEGRDRRLDAQPRGRAGTEGRAGECRVAWGDRGPTFPRARDVRPRGVRRFDPGRARRAAGGCGADRGVPACQPAPIS